MSEVKALLLTKGKQKDGYSGLFNLRLQLWQISPTEKLLDELVVFSGQPGVQNFRVASESPFGSNEPIPEGRYKLGDSDAVRGINWASGTPHNYKGSWGRGLGPVWIGVHPLTGLKTSREAIGIHLDENYLTAPGSAGCLVVPSLEELVALVSWFDHPPNKFVRPTWLVVDWLLGTVDARFTDWMKK